MYKKIKYKKIMHNQTWCSSDAVTLAPSLVTIIDTYAKPDPVNVQQHKNDIYESDHKHNDKKEEDDNDKYYIHSNLQNSDDENNDTTDTGSVDTNNTEDEIVLPCHLLQFHLKHYSYLLKLCSQWMNSTLILMGYRLSSQLHSNSLDTQSMPIFMLVLIYPRLLFVMGSSNVYKPIILY